QSVLHQRGDHMLRKGRSSRCCSAKVSAKLNSEHQANPPNVRDPRQTLQLILRITPEMRGVCQQVLLLDGLQDSKGSRTCKRGTAISRSVGSGLQDVT